MVDALPKAKVLLGDRGYDADWFGAALSAICIAATFIFWQSMSPELR
jgi:hypothetical protein